MIATGTQSGVRAVACALVFATLFASTVGVAAAAGTTDIEVTAERDTLTSGDTTTVEIVVEDADNGVGALNATVTLSNSDVASVESATIHGDPSLERVTERADGVRLSAALADTDDAGSVTVATVVLRAEKSGQTSVDVNVRALGDEGGVAYSVGNVDRPAITVNDVPGSSSGLTDDETSPESTDDGTSSESTDGETASEPTDDETTVESENQEPDDSDDETSGEDRSEPAESTSTEQVVETSGGAMSAIFTPMGAIGVVFLVIGAFVLRRLR